MTRSTTLGRTILYAAFRSAAIVALSVGVGAAYIEMRFPKLRWTVDPESIAVNPDVQREAFISAEQTLELVRAGMDGSQQVALIDARSHENFAEGHIAALTILNVHGDERHEYDLTNLESIEYFTVVVYCTSNTCDLAGKVYDMLVKDLGFEDVLHYHDGWDGWLEAGYETETGPEKFLGMPLQGAEDEMDGEFEDDPEP